MDAHGVEQLLANDHAGIERRGRVLEHDRDDATHVATVLGGTFGNVLALKVDLAARGACRPHMTLAVVDFPQPDSPTMPMVCPGMSLIVTPWTA